MVGFTSIHPNVKAFPPTHQREAGRQLPGPLPFHRSLKERVGGNWRPPHKKNRQKRMTMFGKAADFKNLHFLSFFDILFLDDWYVSLLEAKQFSYANPEKNLSIFHLSPGCCAATRLNLNDCWHNDLTQELCCLILACSTSSQVWMKTGGHSWKYLGKEICLYWNLPSRGGTPKPQWCGTVHDSLLIHCWINLWSSQCQFDPI